MLVHAACKKMQKIKTILQYHLPPSGALCDHPELSYIPCAPFTLAARMHVCKKMQKIKTILQYFHLPPLGALCDHSELSYWPLKNLMSKRMNEQTDK